MHVGRGREHPLHIEYVHIGACLAFIQDTLTEALLSHPRIKMDRKIALIKALGKVIWIQNDLFAKWYVRDGDEFAADMEMPEFEREGYLDGKKVLDDIDESSGDGNNSSRDSTDGSATGAPRTPKTPTTCPFSGIPIRSRTAESPSQQQESTAPAHSEKDVAPVSDVAVNGS